MKVIFLIIAFPALLFSQVNPVELGDVHWLRSMEQAQVQSQEEQKPILILFQEVPGCETCRNYGSEVLTHPLIVEAIETEFIPLAIHNNKGGHDAEILNRYNEPAWNNPVVRIVNQEGDDIVSRLSGDYSPGGIAERMRQALITKNGIAPMYLSLLADELSAQQNGTAQATFSMYCFWRGEALFGKINGVVKTTAGFQNGNEVVVVEYDPRLMTKTQLDKIAEAQSCHVESQGSMRPDSTPKYYLSKSKYRNIPMTEIQKCRVNSALGERQDPTEFLSPRQLAIANNK